MIIGSDTKVDPVLRKYMKLEVKTWAHHDGIRLHVCATNLQLELARGPGKVRQHSHGTPTSLFTRRYGRQDVLIVLTCNYRRKRIYIYILFLLFLAQLFGVGHSSTRLPLNLIFRIPFTYIRFQ